MPHNEYIRRSYMQKIDDLISYNSFMVNDTQDLLLGGNRLHPLGIQREIFNRTFRI